MAGYRATHPAGKPLELRTAGFWWPALALLPLAAGVRMIGEPNRLSVVLGTVLVVLGMLIGVVMTVEIRRLREVGCLLRLDRVGVTVAGHPTVLWRDIAEIRTRGSRVAFIGRAGAPLPFFPAPYRPYRPEKVATRLTRDFGGTLVVNTSTVTTSRRTLLTAIRALTPTPITTGHTMRGDPHGPSRTDETRSAVAPRDAEDSRESTAQVSQYYDVGDRVLWNPSMGVSHLFSGLVPVFEDRVGVPSGIGPMLSDESQVDPAALAVFAQALLDWDIRTGHFINRTMSEGFTATILALAFRAGITITWPPAPTPEKPYPHDFTRAVHLRELAEELESSMPGDRP